MKNIGQRIKELRKKNDLTQEKLADFLGVTYKSVSKWECGMTTPDISLIAPLTKILHVSADELLGLHSEETDLRRAELEENLRQAWLNGGELDGFALVYKAEEDMVREYPGDMKILCDFAWTASNHAIHMEDIETEMLKAVRHFETVIENTEDEKIKASAIQGITQSLAYIEHYDEAKQYVKLLPDTLTITKDSILENCLYGEELRKQRQKRLGSALHSLIVLMEQCNQDKLQAICHCEEIMKIIFPDGDYLEFHCNLLELAYKKARIYTQKGLYREAIAALGEYKEHSIYADLADCPNEEIRYTSPYLDLLKISPSEPDEYYNLTYRKAFTIQIQDEVFAPLRDYDDFKALFE